MKKCIVSVSSIFIVIILLLTSFSLYAKPVQTGSSDDELDQQQTLVDTVSSIYGNVSIVQSFSPSFPILTRVQLYVSRYGNVSSDLRVYIKNSRTSETILTESYVSQDNISGYEPEWITFDFEDIEVDSDETYYLFCDTESGDEDHYYLWYGTNLNPYELGVKYITTNNGISWIQKPNDDCAFKTFGSGPILDLKYVVSDKFNQIEIGIENSGTSSADQIKITSSFPDGFVLKKWFENKVNSSLDPGHKLIVKVSPIIGIGPATLHIDIWAENAQRIETSKDLLLLFFYIYVF